MGPKRVMWVRRYQGQCRALRPLGHQGYRLRSHNKDQPLCSGYIGTRHLTLCPSSTNSLEPSPNLVASGVPASGQHGLVKWGHDAKITKIGVIPTRGLPGQGKANGSQVRRQDPGLLSECTTWN